MRRFAIALIVVVAAAALASYSLAPPPGDTLQIPQGAAPVRGAVHVHTRKSDGTGTVDDVAAAASRAGLSFVVLTDHGDGTRALEPPRYVEGVLCIDAVEISTAGGHVLALGMPHAPYPLGGEARDVVADIARMGGMSIAAHPGSPKPELRWLEWTAPFDGLEWLNADSEWRDEPETSLARTLFTYPLRPAESLAALLDRPDAVLLRWDALTARRDVVAVAGADAHARLWSPEDERSSGAGAAIRLPSYESLFRAFSISLVDVALTGNAAEDAAAVLRALRDGRTFSSIDALAGPAFLTFSASSKSGTAGMGATLAAGAPAAFEVRTNGPSNARIALLRDGEQVAAGHGGVLRHVTSGERGVYRVEVGLESARGQPPVPWVLSNPIYVRAPAETALAPDPYAPPTEFASMYDDGPADARVEASARSQGAFDVVPTVGGTQVSLRFALGGTRSDSPYVALVMPAGPRLSGYDRLMFSGRASVPMRMSVQFRVPQGPAGERWHRSVYLDPMAREIVVPFAQMTPRGATAEQRLPLALVSDLLFVIDTVNTAPGSSGQIWIDDIRYAR